MNIVKIQKALKRPLEDPCGEEYVSKKQIKFIASCIQHYGHLRDASSYTPKLKQLIHPGQETWAQIKKYSVCLFRDGHDFLQTGDWIQTMDGTTGIVMYFTRDQDWLIKVHFAQTWSHRQLPGEWKPFVPVTEQNIQTSIECVTALGQIQCSKSFRKLQLSGYQWRNQKILLQNGDSQTSREKELIQSYTVTSSKLLHFHPLIEKASQFVDLRMSKHQFASLVKASFYPLAVAYFNDEEDNRNMEFCNQTGTQTLPEALCDCCCSIQRIAFNDTGSLSVCVVCYGRLRKVFQMFVTLESLRKTTRAKYQPPEIDTELVEKVSCLLSGAL